MEDGWEGSLGSMAHGDTAAPPQLPQVGPGPSDPGDSGSARGAIDPAGVAAVLMLLEGPCLAPPSCPSCCDTDETQTQSAENQQKQEQGADLVQESDLGFSRWLSPLPIPYGWVSSKPGRILRMSGQTQ